VNAGHGNLQRLVAGNRLVGVSVAVVLLAGLVSAWPAEPCRVDLQTTDFTFPVEQVDPATLCLIEPIINSATTSGLVGPTMTPIPPSFYPYLLDHPDAIASLVERFGIGSYHFIAKGSNQFWWDDREGTQGLLTLLYQDQRRRLYHIDGYHEGHVFPIVRVKAAVFLQTTPVTTPEGYQAIETSLAAYTKLNDPVLATLVSVLKPLIGDAVTRKLTKGFNATTQLGVLIAKDPHRVIQEVRSLPAIQPDEREALTALLQGLPQPTRAPAP
jgi:hypothetical protein